MQVTRRISHWLMATFRYIRGREPIVLIGVLVLVIGIWGFIKLADEVVEGDTHGFDQWTVRALRDANDPSKPIGPEWLASMGRDITGLGGIAVLSLFIAASSGFLAVIKAYRQMWFLVLSTTTGIFVSLLLKNIFERPRPDLVPHLDKVFTSSFPSGHSMMSTLVYLTLGVIVAPVLKHFWVRCYVLGLAVLLAGLVGISRVYMGVHYPSDVLAGWTAGLVWAIACWLLARLWRPAHPRPIRQPIE